MSEINFRIQDDIGIIELDQPDSKVNILTSRFMREFDNIIGDVGRPISNIKGLMITSLKKDIFIAGADIKEIEGIKDYKEGEEKSRQGQLILDKLENLNIPTLAVINGACLGGGLELALCCRYRVAGFSEKIKIGLPEVQLGIIPGFGGTVRLPKIVGPIKAIEMITSGKTISSKDALKIGLVNKLFPDVRLLVESIALLKEIIDKKEEISKRKKKLVSLFIENTPFGNAILFYKAKKMILAQTKGFYPAPLIALKTVRENLRLKKDQALINESRQFGRLAVTEICKNLINLFYLNERYKKKSWIEDEILKPRTVYKCGLLGAGVMGGGIAQLLSFRNIPLRMKDLNLIAISKGLQSANKVYQEAVKKKKLRPNEANFKMGLISGTLDYSGFGNCDFVIEAVVENLDIKKKVFQEVSQVVNENTILASNTSALSVTQMASVCKNPERIVGMHFFNPVHLMPLIEVIKAEKTSSETILDTVDFARRLGKVPIVVKDSCGFLVNRILLPYLNEAGFMLEEGFKFDEIDSIVRRFGLPMGPFVLMDEIGIDVGFKVAKILEEGFGERMQVCSILERVFKEKLLGKKSGSGFYIYKGKKKFPNKKIYRFLEELGLKKENRLNKSDIIKRIIALMINEAARCLDEKIVNEPSDIDIAMIMGTGFPPFRGGLLFYADKVGSKKIVDDLRRFQSVYGMRFEACSYLIRLREENRGFYGIIS